jgi:glutamate racemase
VLATQATVDSGVYAQTIEYLQPTAHCVEVPCPELVPLVESEQTYSRDARQAVQKYLQPLIEAEVDTVVLGCTHYPLLLPVLSEVAPHLHFVDPAETVAQEVQELLGNGVSDSKYFEDDTFFVSGAQSGVARWIAHLLPQSQRNLCCGPVFDMALRAVDL